MRTILIAVLAAFMAAFAHAGEALFSAGGTVDLGKGYIGIPTQFWNPVSGHAYPSQLPFEVPEGKTLLITDLFLETDPAPPNAFLFVLVVEVNGMAGTGKTIHLREAKAEYHAFSTPFPVSAGAKVHVLFNNSMPAPQSVNWAITGRLVDAVVLVENEPTSRAAPALAVDYPYPIVSLLEDVEYVTVSAGHDTTARAIQASFASDFVASPKTRKLARVVKREGEIVVVDRDIGIASGEQLLPVWIADAGTAGNLIVDEEAPPCDQFSRISLVGPIVGVFSVSGCIPRQIQIDKDVDLRPGQRLQYLP